jgi:type III secretion protein L
VIPVAEGLAVDERGVLLGLLVAGAPIDATDRLVGAGAGRCRAALEAVAALPEREWAAARATVASTLRPLARALCALTSEALIEEIDARGAATLGVALSGGAVEVIARAAAGVGEPLARVVLAAAKSVAAPADRTAARALLADVPAAEAAGGAARAVGLRVLARELSPEGAFALTEVAQRLPPALGEVLLACAGRDPVPGVSGAPRAGVTRGHLVRGHGRVVPAVVMEARAEAAAILEAARARAAVVVEDSHRQGLDAGRAEAAAAVVGLLAAGRAEAEAMLERVQPAALAIATRMAEKIVGRAVELDPTTMAAIAAEALDACRTRDGLARLRVHPEDLAAVTPALAALAERLGEGAVLELVADEGMERYGCVVETSVGTVDARLTTQLAALRRALGETDGDASRGLARG